MRTTSVTATWRSRLAPLAFGLLSSLGAGSMACIQEYSLAEVSETGPPGCGEGLTVCDGECVNLTTDHFNCGGCGVECGDEEVCDANVCQPACLPQCDEPTEFCLDGQCACRFGLERCGDVCVNLETDWDHCDGCEQACPEGDVCFGGGCQADCEDLETCGDDCVDIETNPMNCGGCGSLCALDQVCRGGECTDAEEAGGGDCVACPCVDGCLDDYLSECCDDDFLGVPVCVPEGEC